jgi:hypothetical protein
MRMHPDERLVTVADVTCPAPEHMTGKLGRKQYEAIRVGKPIPCKNCDQSWQKSTPTPDCYHCGDNPGTPVPWAILNEGRDLTVILARLVDDGNASPVRCPKIDGETCQEWRGQFSHPDRN